MIPLLLNILPIIVFFIVYKLYNIFTATLVMMLMTLLQTGWYYIRDRKLTMLHQCTLVLVMIAGSLTLFFHNPLYIKLKPTALYWLFAALLGVTQWRGKLLLKRIAGDKINLPNTIWSRLNTAWVLFFLGLGCLNIWIAYHYPTHTWVNFKLYGLTSLTLGFIVIQSLLITPYLKQEDVLHES